MGEDRANSFLRIIRRAQRGRLKVYLGYSAGVGKTYSMLQAAQGRKAEGVDVLIGLTVASVIGFIGSLIAIPLILVRLPADYFDTRTPRHWMKDHHPLLRLLGLIVKNVVGVVFLVAGFAMLFLPGQGLLTMLIGISLMDFPRKRE